MFQDSIGILHPGEMGISVATSAKNSGYDVYWASDGRSVKTKERADQFNLIDLGSLSELCKRSSTIICVCPPNAAEEVADQVKSYSFPGLYIDANAISPERAKRIGKSMEETGISFVDGSIIGGPAWKPGTTLLYLCGEKAHDASTFFSAGPLGTKVIDENIGAASAIKMCYAAYTKGTSALLCAILAAADALGIRRELQQLWSLNGSDFAEKSVQRVRRVTAKAWRFAGEMDEISSTFDRAGLPGEFHAAAGNIYRRLADYKNAQPFPSIEDIITSLIERGDP